MFTQVTKPQVTVTVNNIMAGCGQGTNCDYETSSAMTPKVTAFSISGAAMTITISQATPAVAVDHTLLDITYAEQKCVPASWSGLSIVCNLVKNSDDSNRIVAGDHLPIVHYKAVGYLEYDSALTATAVLPTVSSLSANNGSPNGGHDVDIIGTNFPFALGTNGTNSLTVTVGGAAAKIVSYDNQKINILTPAKGSNAVGVDLIVTSNGKSVT